MQDFLQWPGQNNRVPILRGAWGREVGLVNGRGDEPDVNTRDGEDELLGEKS